MAIISQTSLARSTPDIVLSNVDCDSSVSVGDWVRMSGGVAVKAQADSLDNANIIGLVEYKLNSVKANIRVLGVTPEIFTGLDETKEYFLSAVAAGAMTIQGTIPTAPGHVVLKVGQPFSDKRFLVLKGTRMVRA